MPFEKKPEPRPPKWSITFEDNESISVWKYNTKINPNGPIEVEYKWKKDFNPWNRKKTIGDLAKEQRKKSQGPELGFN